MGSLTCRNWRREKKLRHLSYVLHYFQIWLLICHFIEEASWVKWVKVLQVMVKAAFFSAILIRDDVIPAAISKYGIITNPLKFSIWLRVYVCNIWNKFNILKSARTFQKTINNKILRSRSVNYYSIINTLETSFRLFENMKTFFYKLCLKRKDWLYLNEDL